MRVSAICHFLQFEMREIWVTSSSSSSCKVIIMIITSRHVEREKALKKRSKAAKQKKFDP